MKNTKNLWLIIAITAITALAFTACGNDDPCANGHSFPNWTAPTCTVDGNSVRTCTNCTATDTRTTGYTSLGHDFGEGENENWVVTTPATTEAEGVETLTCKRCPATNGTRPIPMLKSVAEKYRFTARPWWQDHTELGTLTLGVTTITTSEAGFSYSNVYTTDEQAMSYGHGDAGASWAYLYSGDLKIGIVTSIDGGRSRVFLGARLLEGNGMFPGIDASDMQDDHYGVTQHGPHTD